MITAPATAGGSIGRHIAIRQRKRRLSTGQMTAIGVSLAVHLGIGAYLYTARFDLQMHTYEQDRPTDMVFWHRERIPPPPPPHVDRTPPQSTPIAHTPANPTNLSESTPIPIDPMPHDQLVTPSFTSLPEPRDEGGGSATPEPPHHIVGPNWTSRPTASQMSRFYPERAQRLGHSGSASISCTVDATGRLHNCAVSRETPVGEGFGDAALRLSAYFRMSPQIVDGRPIDGGQVNIPLGFAIPDN